MIAVPGNPLEDISVMKRVSFVMKEGKVYKRDGKALVFDWISRRPMRRGGWRGILSRAERRDLAPPPTKERALPLLRLCLYLIRH